MRAREACRPVPPPAWALYSYSWPVAIGLRTSRHHDRRPGPATRRPGRLPLRCGHLPPLLDRPAALEEEVSGVSLVLSLQGPGPDQLWFAAPGELYNVQVYRKTG